LLTQAVLRGRQATAGHRLPRAAVADRATANQPAVARSGEIAGRGTVGGHRPLLYGSLFIQPPCPLLPTSLPPPSYLFAPKFFHMWSTLPH
jgi:hypothetical protein